MRQPLSIAFCLAFVSGANSQVFAQTLSTVVPFFRNSVVRITSKQSGAKLVGCGSLDSTPKDPPGYTLDFDYRPRVLERGFPAVPCVPRTDTAVKYPLGSFQQLELGQPKNRVGASAARGAFIGGLAAEAIYWALDGSPKKCRHCLIHSGLGWFAAGALVGAAGGALTAAGSPTIQWIPIFGGSAAPRRDSFWDWFLKFAKVEATAGAGFAGVRVAEVLKTDPRDSTYVPLKNYRYDWRPAVSSGLVTYLHTEKDSQLGVGLGFQIVALPTSEAKTNPFPAITLHVGTPETEFFVGMILSPTDSVYIPPTPDGLPAGRLTLDPKTLVLPGVRTSRNLYMGIQIKGSRKGSEDLGVPENGIVKITLDSTTLPDSVRLSAHLEDARGRELSAGTPHFEVIGTQPARINAGDWLVPISDQPSSITVIARIGSASDFKTIALGPKKAAGNPTSPPKGQ